LEPRENFSVQIWAANPKKTLKKRMRFIKLLVRELAFVMFVSKNICGRANLAAVKIAPASSVAV